MSTTASKACCLSQRLTVTKCKLSSLPGSAMPGFHAVQSPSTDSSTHALVSVMDRSRNESSAACSHPNSNPSQLWQSQIVDIDMNEVERWVISACHVQLTYFAKWLLYIA